MGEQKSKVLFLEMFREYAPEDADLWRTVELESAQLDAGERRISLELSAPGYIPKDRVDRTVDQLTKLYDLNRLELRLHYPQAALEQVPPRELVDLLCGFYAPSRAILAGSRWEISRESIAIHLAANGKDQLEPHLHHLHQAIHDWFGVTPEITVHAHSALEGQALYDETERIRQEALTSNDVSFRTTLSCSTGWEAPTVRLSASVPK